jgi:hypothetical protein
LIAQNFQIFGFNEITKREKIRSGLVAGFRLDNTGNELDEGNLVGLGVVELEKQKFLG